MQDEWLGKPGIFKHLHISSQKANGTQTSEVIHNVGIADAS